MGSVHEVQFSRGETIDHKYWLQLIDRAIDIMGQTAASHILAEAYASDDHQQVMQAINSHIDSELLDLMPATA